MSRFELRTERLLLRDFVPADFEPFYATTADPEYRRFYAQEETSRDCWRVIFDRILAEAAAEGRLIYQLAISLPGGPLIGTCGVRIDDVSNRQASFGCAIAFDYWGGGMAERLGMRLEGVLRQNRFFRGRWWDMAVYGILREELRGG